MVPAHVITIASEMRCDVHTDVNVCPYSFTSPTRLLFALVYFFYFSNSFSITLNFKNTV